MKAKIDDKIRTLVDLHSDFGDRLIPKGTMGAIVECYEHPVEGYAVDLAIPDGRSVSGFDYENVILYPDQFEVIFYPDQMVLTEALPSADNWPAKKTTFDRRLSNGLG